MNNFVRNTLGSRAKKLVWSIVACLSIAMICSAVIGQVWTPDRGDGRYTNPIIHADYSDPDVIKVGDDFFMTASSFNCVPALPILHSRDLVNWTLINHAIPRFDDTDFNMPQHGNGVWAPAIRFHDGWFYIYYGDPDRGIFMIKTEDPYGEWDDPILVKKAYGNIDPCPLWDDDGRVYMVHAFAHSRAGVKSILQVNELSQDGTEIIDKGYIVFDGHQEHPTIEGPKFYKGNDFYYIFAPAGGVKNGWQTVLRSKHVLGPYEIRTVMAQGDTDINGPHQGAYIELENGEGWFVHFQDKGAYGRVVHLQPVRWHEDWPVIGSDTDGDGTGEPLLSYRKPDVGKSWPVSVPQTSDEFSASSLGLQWQWHANPEPGWYSLSDKPGVLRLYSQKTSGDAVNLWLTPNLLLQKFPASEFTVKTDINIQNSLENGRSGLIVMGLDYAFVSVRRTQKAIVLEQVYCQDAENGGEEKVIEQVVIDENSVFLKVEITDGALGGFSYSLDGSSYKTIGKKFKAKAGKWIGAKVGLFTLRPVGSSDGGFVDFNFFRIE